MLKKNGIINYLFEKEEPKLYKDKDSFQYYGQKFLIKKFIDSNVFTLKNNLKNVRIIKMPNSKEESSISKKEISKIIEQEDSEVIVATRDSNTEQKGKRNLVSRTLSPSIKERRISRHNQPYVINEFDQKINEIRRNKEILKTSEDKSRVISLVSKRYCNTIELIEKKSVQKKDLPTNTSLKIIQTTPLKNRIQRKYLYEKNIMQKYQDDKKAQLEVKREITKIYTYPHCTPDNITAKSYIVHELSNKANKPIVHLSFNSKIAAEIASLTKIMTCILSIEICEKARIDISQQKVHISQFEINVIGTSASIKNGDIYTIQDLFYGLMLPSGNDASLALGAFFGKFLCEKEKIDCISQTKNKRQYCNRFIAEMNRKAASLGMKKTFYSNTHGLASNISRSCASDLVALISYALENQKFRKIIKTRKYETTIQISSLKSLKAFNKSVIIPKTKKVSWQNTHKLLFDQPSLYFGIKTGVTETAGPCLASLVVVGQRQFIIIVLNSRSLKYRFKDTQELRKWVFTKQKIENVATISQSVNEINSQTLICDI